MLQDIEEREGIILDGRRLKNKNYGWRQEIKKIDNVNTYNEIIDRISDFMSESLSDNQLDVLTNFKNFCKEYYNYK